MEENIATYLEFLLTSFSLPLVIKTNKAPIKGIKIIAESIGKFISIKLKRLIIKKIQLTLQMHNDKDNHSAREQIFQIYF